MNEHSRVLSVTRILGNKVINTECQQLGNIKELIGQVTCAALSFGSFLGVGDKLFAIPLEALI